MTNLDVICPTAREFVIWRKAFISPQIRGKRRDRLSIIAQECDTCCVGPPGGFRPRVIRGAGCQKQLAYGSVRHIHWSRGLTW